MPVVQGEPLSVRLLAETRVANSAARLSGFLDSLAAGRLPLDAYVDLAAQHWFVYDALELAATAMVDDPVARVFIFPELHRVPALEADLAYLRGPGWANRIEALPATTTYCTRVRQMAFSGAPGFVAHHYARYIDDLTGGQEIGPAIARAYRLTGGCRFFAFDRIDPVEFRERYRTLLDTVAWSRSEERQFLAEVIEAYRLNIAMLAELRERWP